MECKLASLELLVEKYNLTADSMGRQVSDAVLVDISQSCCEKWRLLPSYLEMVTMCVSDVERDNKSEEEKRLGFFKLWKHRNGFSATYRALICALLKIGYRQDAEHVCKLLNKSLATSENSAVEKVDTTQYEQEVHTEKSSDPSIKPDAVVLEDLKQKLENDLKHIMHRYASYVSSIRRSLKEKGVTASELCAHLMTLPAFSSDHYRQGPVLLSGSREELQRAETVDQIFITLCDKYTSFLDYDIFQSLLNEYGSSDRTEKLDYPCHLKEYIGRQRLKEFVDINPLLETFTDTSKKVVLKLDIESTCHLAKVVDVKKSFSNILGINGSALRIIDVKEGCVELTLLMPAHLADYIFVSDNIFTPKDVKLFQELSVTQLKCNEHSYMFLSGDEATDYPKQHMVHKLNDYLTVGVDGYYFIDRDYTIIKKHFRRGGFNTVRVAKDLTSGRLFAIKHNERDEDFCIESITTEARMLARLRPHANVVRMYGALLDVKESPLYRARMFKLMLEWAEHGNLSNLLIDPETMVPASLEVDQALYYFWQLLKGVHFLHSNGVLHLDIKSSSILVFDEGRHIRICNFDSAVHIGEPVHLKKRIFKTQQFAAPEICKQQMPDFSSDIWSSMCVLVEMLTAKFPWNIPNYYSTMSVILMVGSYTDDQMETDLIPDAERLDREVIELMRLAFRKETSDRATAMELLNHPLIVDAYTYEACFDEALKEAYEDESLLYLPDEEKLFLKSSLYNDSTHGSKVIGAHS